MLLLDTNTILRYLLHDNKEQADKATEVIKSGACTTPEVLAEVVYVLSGLYKTSREDISWAIHCILIDIKVDNLKSLRYALGLYNQTSLDFVDCLLIAYHKVLGVEVFSFDKKLNSNLEMDHPILQQPLFSV